MKTSHVLLAIIAVVTLTGMVATDVLLKQQYEKVDWSDPYQNFEQRAVPASTHWVIKGAATDEIIVEQSTGLSQALVEPNRAKLFQMRQQGDTTYIVFPPAYEYDVKGSDPHREINYELPAGLVLRLPDLQSLRITNSRLTLRKLKSSQLTVSLQNSRLRTTELAVANAFALTADQNSFALLGPDRYQSLRLTVRDSSGVQLNDTQTEQFLPDVSPRAEVQLRGRALRWLAK